MGKFNLRDETYRRLLNIHKSYYEVKHIVDCWGVKACERGYAEFDYDGTGLLCIEAIDVIGLFRNDTEATKQAVKDGVKIIPVEELPKTMPKDMRFFGWVDTPENRKAIQNKYGVKQTKPKTPKEQGIEDVKRKLDRIFDIYEDINFIEISGEVGGDELTFRVYNDGLVTQR